MSVRMPSVRDVVDLVERAEDGVQPLPRLCHEPLVVRPAGLLGPRSRASRQSRWAVW